ncbi:DUF983 domain-containing protein [uncultured Jannaschia sp.]|uniref:DUF983 domain-containing protein n=1 Tax=uncultured Jannaschia sp. TaxID=293347 RepID=UPI00260CBB69|nr:DUF983 domain-containing protein [uncultured Jannaschia sp.]
MTDTMPGTTTDREMKRALWRGWRRRCPNCGEGAMMDGYLAVNDACPHCGEALHHHRADDGPPYLTLLIVGHIVGPAMLWGYIAYEPTPLVFIAVFGLASILMSLWFLPRLKGFLVAMQWATRMGGFGRADPAA